MLTRVELTNFRGFKQLELDLKQVCVVVGPNSSGKTSVLHAISLALRAYALALEEPDAHPVTKGETIQVCGGLIVRDHTRLLPIAERNELFRNAAVSDGVTSTVTLSFDRSTIEKLTVQLAYMRNAVLKLTVSVVSGAALAAVVHAKAKSKARPAGLLEALQTGRPSAVLVPAFYGVTLAEEYRTARVVEEFLQAGQQSSIVRNLVARLGASDFTELNQFLFRTIGAKIESRTTAADAEQIHPLAVRFADTNGALDLSAAGAGLVNLVALFSALKFQQQTRKGTTIFLFDEPEAHLHPRLQGTLGDELATTIRSFSDAQMVVATHSVEMINRLGRRDDAVLFSVDRAGVAVELDSESQIVDAMASWADLSPYTSLSFLASRQLLFHEGPSDAQILEVCAEAYFANDPVKRAAFRRWSFAALDGSGNAPALKALEKVIQPKVFPDLKQGERVRLWLVLDRDHARQPGTTRSTEGHTESTELVWERHSIESLFLEPSVLSMWLSASLSAGPAESTLAGYVRDAIAIVDKDEKLNADAGAGLQTQLLRNRQLSLEAAFKEAMAMAQGEPAVWQKGRARASRVLQEVRKQLPHVDQRHVRSSIATQLAEAERARLPDPVRAVPQQIRDLLDEMVKSVSPLTTS